jgi:peptidoglycan hydrolase-like protein with peptidoglycan-binding domain
MHPVRTLAVVVTLALGLSLGVGQPASADEPNPVTPGDFAGFGFDQCLTPEQHKMNAWLESSPFLAVGIYIAGNSRACRSQPNLTPAWVRTQLAKGWRLLPITLGPQADCLDRFPRYKDDPTINPKPGRVGRYSLARKQGTAEARTTVAEAGRLGIVPGSTLWYDLEGFNINITTCRESALWFLSGWSKQIRRMGYVSGVYSSVGSGIRMLDDARVKRPGVFELPDRIWLARWDGVANTSSDYILEDGWRPGGRVKQYKGGHDERWGGVRINIDTNYLDLGNGLVAPAETHCDGVRVNFKGYPRLAPPTPTQRPSARKVTALKCLLREQSAYTGNLNGGYTPKLVAAIRAWKQQRGLKVSDAWSQRNWLVLFASGTNPVVKVGSTGGDVRRLQRALNAANDATRLPVSGVFDGFTDRAVRAYQARHKLEGSGVAGAETWAALAKGVR